MTKSQLYILQNAANVLRDVSLIYNVTFDRLSMEFNIATISALDAIVKIEKIVNDNPKRLLDHPFWNGELSIEISYEQYEKNKSYIATWERDEENGDFNLEIYLEEEGSGDSLPEIPEGQYSNYMSRSDIHEDLETMRSLGYSIKVHPDYLPVID